MPKIATKAALLLLVGIPFLSACALPVPPGALTAKVPYEPSQSSASAVETFSSKPKKISIIFSHDIHSNLDESAKAKTIIDEAKKTGSNPLILDSGDFSMGTLYQTIFRQSAPELKMFGMLGYDAVTAGNHDFDYGGGAFAEMLDAAKDSGLRVPSMIVSNIDWEKSLKAQKTSQRAFAIQESFQHYGVINDYEIFEKNGTKIAVFGLFGKECASYAPQCSLYFKDPIKSAKKIVQTIKTKEKADVIICLSHSGTSEKKSDSEDELLAQAVPDIDVIISGHSHTLLREPIMAGNTIIASCGKYARRLGFMELSVSSKSIKLERYETIRLDHEIESDQGITAELKKMRQEVQHSYLDQFGYEYNQVLAYNPYRFTPYAAFAQKQQEYPLGNIVADSYAYAVELAEGRDYEPVDVSIVPSGSIRASLSQGELTVSDVFNVSALGIGADGTPGSPLITCYITGKELKTAAEADASIPAVMPDSQLFMRGLSYTFNAKRLLLNKVISVYLEPEDGVYQKIEDDKLYRVVTGLDTLTMLDALNKKTFGLLSITPKDKNGRPIDKIEDHIVHTGNGEMKEWIALASYLESFPKEDGIAVIPEYYSQTHNRKVVSDDINILELVKRPNKIFLILVGMTSLLLFCAVKVITFIVKKNHGGEQ